MPTTASNFELRHIRLRLGLFVNVITKRIFRRKSKGQYPHYEEIPLVVINHEFQILRVILICHHLGVEA